MAHYAIFWNLQSSFPTHFDFEVAFGDPYGSPIHLKGRYSFSCGSALAPPPIYVGCQQSRTLTSAHQFYDACLDVNVQETTKKSSRPEVARIQEATQFSQVAQF